MLQCCHKVTQKEEVILPPMHLLSSPILQFFPKFRVFGICHAIKNTISMQAISTEAVFPSHPLKQTHFLEVRTGVAQSLQSVGQVIVSTEVEAICSQHIVHHGQESLILLRLEEKQTGFKFKKKKVKKVRSI